jgi:hypothetical protein
MEIIMLVAWAIWTTHKDFIFKGVSPSLYRCRNRFRDEMALLKHKAVRKSYISIADWVNSFH